MFIKNNNTEIIINESNIKRFLEIMSNNKKIRIPKVENHKDVTSKEEIKKLLNI